LSTLLYFRFLLANVKTNLIVKICKRCWCCVAYHPTCSSGSVISLRMNRNRPTFNHSIVSRVLKVIFLLDLYHARWYWTSWKM